ncbi:MAG: hypothetical protein A2138_17590 [Deltaproteobacteria bacterium RBG_16_71_12]|nr:MAG: hypothetical protein A2138_17590 [Deltaproteobacteria bacterium RBG_16_71_12]
MNDHTAFADGDTIIMAASTDGPNDANVVLVRRRSDGTPIGDTVFLSNGAFMPGSNVAFTRAGGGEVVAAWTIEGGLGPSGVRFAVIGDLLASTPTIDAGDVVYQSVRNPYTTMSVAPFLDGIAVAFVDKGGIDPGTGDSFDVVKIHAVGLDGAFVSHIDGPEVSTHPVLPLLARSTDALALAFTADVDGQTDAFFGVVPETQGTTALPSTPRLLTTVDGSAATSLIAVGAGFAMAYEETAQIDAFLQSRAVRVLLLDSAGGVQGGPIELTTLGAGELHGDAELSFDGTALHVLYKRIDGAQSAVLYVRLSAAGALEEGPLVVNDQPISFSSVGAVPTVSSTPHPVWRDSRGSVMLGTACP